MMLAVDSFYGYYLPIQHNIKRTNNMISYILIFSVGTNFRFVFYTVRSECWSLVALIWAKIESHVD